MDCNACKEKREQERPTISRYAFESAITAMETICKRLWIAIIVLIILLAASNGAWIYYESQFEDESWSFEATTEDGGNAIANGNGEVFYYGESKSDASEANP